MPGGSKKRPVRTGAVVDSAYSPSSDDTQSSSDDSSVDIMSSSSLSADDTQLSSSSEDSNSSSDLDNLKSSSSDDNAIPLSKSVHPDTSKIALRSHNATKPSAPYKRTVKASALSSSDSDDDKIPSPPPKSVPQKNTKTAQYKRLKTIAMLDSTSSSSTDSDDGKIPNPQLNHVPQKTTSNIALRSHSATTKPSQYKRLKASAVLDSTTSPSSDSDDGTIPNPRPKPVPQTPSIGLSRRRDPKSKPPVLMTPPKPPVTMATAPPKPLVPMKRSHPVSTSSGGGNPPLPLPTFYYPPTKIAKIAPLPNPNVLSSLQMNAALLNVTKPLPKYTPPPVIIPPPTPAQVVALTQPPPPPQKASTSSSAQLKSPIAPSKLLYFTPKRFPVCPNSVEILMEIMPGSFQESYIQTGEFQAKILPQNDPTFELISEYITNSQAHAGFKLNLQSVLKINRPSSSSASTTSTSPAISTNPPKFTMMLWHGTKPQNVVTILQNGFRCPATGIQMFGQGVYFADRISKSAQYCGKYPNFVRPRPGDTGYLFLCEVEIGRCYNARVSNPSYKAVPTATRRDGSLMTFDSVMCTGGNVPDRTVQKEVDGVTWPVGATVPNTKFAAYTVLYNEYIVYDPEKIKIKFLVKVLFE